MPIQAPQWTDFLSCPICYNEFNENQRKPISLGCGHTVCQTCLGQFHSKQCPFDQTAITVDTDVLPVNYAILQLVNGDVQKSENGGLEGVSEFTEYYQDAMECIEELALYLKPFSGGGAGNNSPLSRPMQRKLVTLVNCQLVEDEGRARAMRAARSLGERTVTELILQHQNPQQLSQNLWAAVRARGCQFLGPAMQEETLKLILLALEDGSALSRKVLVMFVVQRLEKQFSQASKTSIGHVVQLLYRASCFKVYKRDGDSSLMELKEEFRTYDGLRREHDAQIVQIAMEAGLRISPEQWSSLLYGDTAHKSHMQSIIDKLQTPASFSQSVNELVIALQRSGDPASLSRLRPYFDELAKIDPSPDGETPLWDDTRKGMQAVKLVVQGVVDFIQNYCGNRKGESAQVTSGKYKTSMCRDLNRNGTGCPRGVNCTFAHSDEEMYRYRARNRKAVEKGNTKDVPVYKGEVKKGSPLVAKGTASPPSPPPPGLVSRSTVSDHSSNGLVPRESTDMPSSQSPPSSYSRQPAYPPRVSSMEQYPHQPPGGTMRQPLPADMPPPEQGPTYMVETVQVQMVPVETGYPGVVSGYYPPQHHPQYITQQPPPPMTPPYSAQYPPPTSYRPQEPVPPPPMPYRTYVQDSYGTGVYPPPPPPSQYPPQQYPPPMDRGVWPRYPVREDVRVPTRGGYAGYDGMVHPYPGPYQGSMQQPTNLQNQSLEDLQRRREELLAQLNHPAHCMPVARSPSPSPYSSPAHTPPSTLNSKATPFFPRKPDYANGTEKEGEVQADGAGQTKEYSPWSSGVLIQTKDVMPHTATPSSSSTVVVSSSQSSHSRNYLTESSLVTEIRRLSDEALAQVLVREDLNYLRGKDQPGYLIRQEVQRRTLERAKELEDDLIPFSSTPIVSKYGPISRTARAMIRNTGPYQSNAIAGNTSTVSVKSTENMIQSTHERVHSPTDPEEQDGRYNKKPAVEMYRGVWNITDRINNLPSVPVSTSRASGTSTVEREQLKLELRQINNQINSHHQQQQIQEAKNAMLLKREQDALAWVKSSVSDRQLDDDQRLAYELQRIELGIREKERELQNQRWKTKPRSQDDTASDFEIARQLQEFENGHRPKPGPEATERSRHVAKVDLTSQEANDYRVALEAQKAEELSEIEYQVRRDAERKQRLAQERERMDQEERDRRLAEQLVYSEVGYQHQAGERTSYASAVADRRVRANVVHGAVRDLQLAPRISTGQDTLVTTSVGRAKPCTLPTNVVEDSGVGVH
ncbi:PREDICTED: roquin-1-like isoform X2 [Branchiostoma belcheri]|uniref:RING-type E3 ubiquitin transferase n=1 Tax=Branchiostoma belcheri TaxID=7741 RepID=A0A6P5ABK4_BRABE|nr:PREDICTED: roquin-1-like isoform X2 [Branchiostoma belcheri]